MPTERASRVILVRHGQSQQHVSDLTGGWTDAALTERGLWQAQRTAARVAELVRGREALPRLLSSDLRRASRTAEIIALALAVSPQLHPELRELNNGAAANLTRQQARQIELPLTEPAVDWIPYSGAESWRMMERRVRDFLDGARADDGETTVIVTHENAGVVVVQWWLRLGECCRRGTSFGLDPGSVTVLTSNDWGERCVSRLNDTAHLTAAAQPSPQATRD